MGARKRKQRIAVLDFETDPFLHGRIPEPFSWGFYDGDRYIEHWQDRAWESPGECAKILAEFLQDQETEYIVYAHNGGKFDFVFLLEWLGGSLRIVNGRILQAQINNVTLRDSYAILPIPLAQAGDKLDIDYWKMERHCREEHKTEILHYLKQDCVALFELVTAFREEFGDILTIGSASMKELKSFHDYESGDERFDSAFRKFYFGGRCQCFETGVISTQVKGFDINSSYPRTMRDLLHPVSVDHCVTRRVGKKTAFVTWEGQNLGAVPVRTKQGLDFTCSSGTFHSTIHEFNMGLETGTIIPNRIVEAYHFTRMESFSTFIEHFYLSRLAAKKAGNKFLDIFYKLILNSAYGKFAQNPEGFEDFVIVPYGDIMPEPYQLAQQNGKYAIWSKPSTQRTFYNVATAASITGGSRASLLHGLSRATRPLYCDTDSIYCEDFTGKLDDKELGAWKHEFTGHQIAIAGKKLYAVMGEKDGQEVCLKKASKGTTLNPLAIFMIARGDTCETRNDAPSFKLDGKHQFIKRAIRRTG